MLYSLRIQSHSEKGLQTVRQNMSWQDYFLSRLILFISFLIATSLLGLGLEPSRKTKKNNQNETVLSELQGQ